MIPNFLPRCGAHALATCLGRHDLSTMPKKSCVSNSDDPAVRCRPEATGPETLKFPLQHPPKDLKGLQKYRIGDYRILLWVDHKARQITLYGVEHRRSVYDDL